MASGGSHRERGKTNVPTLLLRGENEVKNKKGNPAEMPFLSNVQYVVLPDCGHMLNMEQPELFNKQVLDFLSHMSVRPRGYEI